MKNAKKGDAVLIFSAGALCLLGGLSLLLFPSPRFSECENRLLANAPDFSLSALADGTYTAAWEGYAAERMTGRRLMRGVHARAELLLGKCQTGDVIVCRDGGLSKRLGVQTHAYQKNLGGIKRLKSTAEQMGTPLAVCVAPRRIEARSDALPRLYCQEKNTANTLAKALPDATLLAVSGDAEWYRTDHHWSTTGAFCAYLQICEKLGVRPYAESDFTRQTVSEGFFGTSDAAAGLLDVAPDKIELWRYEGDNALCVTREAKNAPFEGLYDLDRLSTRDGYAVFLGGNCGVTEIRYGEKDTRPTLLVIKDSFANSVIPFLARHYQIIAVDPRYATTDLTPFFERADQALLLIGLQTLSLVEIF